MTQASEPWNLLTHVQPKEDTRCRHIQQTTRMLRMIYRRLMIPLREKVANRQCFETMNADVILREGGHLSPFTLYRDIGISSSLRNISLSMRSLT